MSATVTGHVNPTIHDQHDQPSSKRATPQMTGTLARFAAIVAMWSGGGALIGLALVGGNALLPADWQPGRLIARTIGGMVGEETAAHMEATTEFTRRNAIAQTLPPVKMQALSQSLEAQAIIANYTDTACAVSGLFEQFPALRDVLRGGCGVGANVRQNMMREYDRNVMPPPAVTRR